jgi:hypothetical protein
MQQYKGTALTIVTSIGFAITIVSIQLMQMIFQKANEALWILVVGPLLGLIALNKWEKSLPAKNRQSTIIER